MDRKQIEAVAKSSVERGREIFELFESESKMFYSEVAVEKIHPDPEQPRKKFTEESLQSLAETISRVGILQPLRVEYNPDSRDYKIITGERRYRAARMAGLTKVPCLVTEANAEERLLHRLIENLQREDLHPIERAEGIHALMTLFNYTQRDIAKALGRKESTISEDLSVLKLPEDIKQKLRRAEVSKRTTVQIASEKDAGRQKELAERVLEDRITSEDIKKERKKNPFNPFVYESEDGKFTVTVQFRRTQVTREVLIVALRKTYLLVKSGEGALLSGDNGENQKNSTNL